MAGDQKGKLPTEAGRPELMKLSHINRSGPVSLRHIVVTDNCNCFIGCLSVDVTLLSTVAT